MHNTNDDIISYIIPTTDQLFEIKHLILIENQSYYYKKKKPVPLDIDYYRRSNSSGNFSDFILETKFNKLMSEWKKESSFSSNVIEICNHPAYQQIIGIGPAAVPLILKELEKEMDHWFWALKAITNQNPVKQSEMGNLKLMTAAWLKWGKSRKML